MASKPPPETHATLGSLLRRPYEHLQQLLYAELARRGFEDVRPAYSAVLRNLPQEGATVSELAGRAAMSKQSMAYLVEQMRKAGLVEVCPHPTDRRATTVRLAPRGEEAVATALTLSQHFEAHLTRLIGAQKVKELRSLLEEAGEALEAAPPDEP